MNETRDRSARALAAAGALVLVARLHPIGLPRGWPDRPSWFGLVALVLLMVAASVRSSSAARWTGGRSPRRWVWLAAAVLVLVAVSVSARRALHGLALAPGPVQGTATLLDDPVRGLGSTSVDVRLAGKHLRARASGGAASTLARRSAGDRVEIAGTVRIASLPAWRVARHLAGDLTVREVGASSAPVPLLALANRIRSRLLASATVLPPTDRVLFAGFVLGDDRGQSALITDDFRGAGLSHLLVVSGQNVAFTLSVFAPLLRRLGRRRRLAVVLAVLVLFAAVTRFEPSVLRAATMAALTATTTMLGRPQPALRILAGAVMALVLVDPLLAWSVGFALSVAACLGLGLIQPLLAARLRSRLPAWFADPIATALGAELGVATVLVPIFGGLPLASLPANLLALPAAEPVMAWGVAAGLPAGLVEPWLGRGPARLVHMPTQLALTWVRIVARRGASLPLGELGGGAAMLAALAFLVWLAGPRLVRRFGVAGMAGAIVVPLVQASPAGFDLAAVSAIGVRGRVERRVDVLVLDHLARPDRVLEALRRHRVRAIDLLVVRSGGRPQSSLVDAVAARVDVGAVLAGDRAFAGRVRPVVVGTPGLIVRAGSTRVRVEAVRRGRLIVVLSPVAPARAPPASPVWSGSGAVAPSRFS